MGVDILEPDHLNFGYIDTHTFQQYWNLLPSADPECEGDDDQGQTKEESGQDEGEGEILL